MITRELKNVMFVDPGIMGTGVAFFPLVTPNAPIPHKPTQWTVFKSKQEPWDTKAIEITAQVAGFIAGAEVRHVVLEFPGLFGSSSKSFASASSGDLFKLTYLIGCLGIISGQLTGNKPILTPVAQWKGQLPKEVVIARIKRVWSDLPEIPNHAADAVGMGLSAQGGMGK